MDVGVVCSGSLCGSGVWSGSLCGDGVNAGVGLGAAWVRVCMSRRAERSLQGCEIK